ncbi:uncharacterized protein LOC109827766 [Asparagus officinalis]|uniref:uncharacterized protein LOC109827766 n=1 Tax=Asparagus officinalis TaxID=4686 RepID=UPI00098E858E|nr:uncharacterized protein LOC109827766 [Asparagus officinalis]
MTISTLSSTQKYAAGAVFALALRQAQIHQSHPLGFGGARRRDDDQDDDGDQNPASSSSSIDSSHLWTHPSCGLLRPVFRFLEIDDKAWPALEETAASSVVKHHIGAFFRLIFEDIDEENKEFSRRSEQQHALAKAVDVTVKSFEASSSSVKTKNKYHEQSQKYHPETTNRNSIAHENPPENLGLVNSDSLARTEEVSDQISELVHGETSMGVGDQVKYQRKISVLFELLSACVADTPEDKRKSSRDRKGYDARHRVALRLLATWLDVKWIQMEAMEIMVACSAMAAAKGEEQSQESESKKSKWAKWKRGGIIGAAALTGGTLLAITGGLAAPAIAAGFSALAPTLGTLVPVIGAGGFAAVASAAGSVAGSVAVAASFGAAGAGLSGTKMARRIGSIEEFEFKPIGENHNQGHLAVGILISGFVFNDEDFIKPWEECEDNLERYFLYLLRHA